MRVLVTGGGGFLGSHICDVFSERGWNVRVLDRRPSRWLRNDQQMVVADVGDREALAHALIDCDAVYHCAAVADLEEARIDPIRAVETNVTGTVSVLLAAADAGVARFIHASTVYVLSRSGSVYKTTKAASEQLVRDLGGRFAVAPTILRFGSLYGPRAEESNAVQRMVQQAVDDGRIDFWGDGSEVREYIHIRDAAALAGDVVLPDYSGETLHITGQARISTREILATINEILGGKLAITLQDRPYEGRYHMTPYAVEPDTGRRINANTHIDLGLGLWEMIKHRSELSRAFGGEKSGPDAW